MSSIEDRLADYRTLRDSSRKVLMADIKHARSTFTINGLTSRYLGGVAEGAKDVYEVAKVHSVDNRGLIAIVLGALALWFGREPLLAAMAEDLSVEESEAENSESGNHEDQGLAEATSQIDGFAQEPPSPIQQSETDIPPEDTSSGDSHDH